MESIGTVGAEPARFGFFTGPSGFDGVEGLSACGEAPAKGGRHSCAKLARRRRAQVLAFCGGPAPHFFSEPQRVRHSSSHSLLTPPSALVLRWEAHTSAAQWRTAQSSGTGSVPAMVMGRQVVQRGSGDRESCKRAFSC